LINLKENRIELGNSRQEIVRWEVWFRTPMGLFKNLEECIKHLESCDMLPDLNISPVPVAISSSLYEVI
jgi:hypothetical protein